MEDGEEMKCARCDELPQIKCYCLEMPLALCSLCAVSHFLEDSPSVHRPFPIEQKPATHSDLCGVCQLSPASKMCTCMFPWISYCADCAAIHVSGEAGHLKHSLEPLSARHFLQSTSDLPQFYERQHFVEELETEVMKNVQTIGDCIAQVNAMAKQLIMSIEGWRDNAVKHLLEVQEKVAQNVELGCKQLESQRYEAAIDPNSRLEQLLILAGRDNLDTLKKEVSMVRFSLDADRLLAQIPNLLKFSENYLLLEQVNKLFYVVPRTNRLVTLDLPETAPRETILNTDFKFKSAAAWCKLQSGELFLCGGVRQRNGATYYKEAVLIDPSTKQVKPLPPMKTTRCRHAVTTYRDSVYVFGGYNETLLKACERFDILENRWNSLPDLKEGKDCVSASVWKDKAYIVGYGSNKVEVYDFPTGNMFALPVSFRSSVMNMLIPKHCSILSIINGEMTILTESELLRLNVDGHNVRSEKLPAKLERAWYSQCTPGLLKNQEVLFFTLDQELWRLTLATNDLKLLLTIK